MTKSRDVLPADGKVKQFNASPRTNHLLVIGIDEYEHCGKLNNAVTDANQFVELLNQEFEFDEQHTTTLFDQKASKRGIIEALEPYASLTDQDNLVIYFSGHGHYDDVLKEAYWVPVDAQYEAAVDYIPYHHISLVLKASKAHHILLIIDSCYSGATLIRDIPNQSRFDRDPSRWLFASGRNEVVPDGIEGENSPFSESVLDVLRRYANEGIRASSLIDKVITSVVYNSPQTPIGRPMYNAGPQGGEFVFYPKGSIYKSAPTSIEVSNSGHGGSSKYGSGFKSLGKLFKKPSRLLGAIYLLLFILVITYGAQKKVPVSAEVELWTERVSFTLGAKPLSFVDMKFEEAYLDGFSQVDVPLTQGQFADTSLSFDRQYTLQMEPLDPGSRIANIHLEDGNLAKWKFNHGDELTLSSSQESIENDSLLSLDIVRKSDSVSTYTLDYETEESLRFQSEYLFYSIDNVQTEWENLSGKINSMDGSKKIIVNNTPGTQGLHFVLSEEASLDEREFLIGEFQVSKRDNEREISTIKKGNLSILSRFGEEGQELNLQEGTSLRLEEDEPILVKKLLLTDKGIYMSLAGKFKQVSISGELQKISRSLLEHWLVFKRLNLIVFLLIASAILGLVYFFEK